MWPVYRVLILIVMTSLLTSCFGFGSKDPDDVMPHYYVIDVDRGSVATSFAKDRVLLVKPVRLTPHFRGKNIVFRVGEDEYQSQTPHEFFTDPEDMFTEQLRRWLQKSGLFSQVVINEDNSVDMILETAVTALYGEKREQYSAQAVLEMQFFLMSAEAGSEQVLFQTGLRTDVDIDETTPVNVVKGWKQGLEGVLETVEDDFSGYFSKRSP